METFWAFQLRYLACSINHNSKVLPLVQLSFTHWKPLAYFQRYFQPKFVNLTQSTAKTLSETFAQASNLSNLHHEGTPKPCMELLILQCLLRKITPKPKWEPSYLLQHYSAILCCTVAQAKTVLTWTEKDWPQRVVHNHTGKWGDTRAFWKLNHFLLVCAFQILMTSQ